MIAALEMLALAPVEMRAPFLVHQPGSRIGKGAVGIAQSLDPLGIEEQRPARTQTPQRIVRPRTDRDQFGFGRGFKIGTAKPQRALETAVLVQHHAGREKRGPGKMIGKPVGCRSEEYTSELTSLMRMSYDVFC